MGKPQAGRAQGTRVDTPRVRVCISTSKVYSSRA